jgi:hypothetical protein
MLEMKAALAHVVRKYTFSHDTSKPADIKLKIALTPEGGVHLFFKHRVQE